LTTALELVALGFFSLDRVKLHPGKDFRILAHPTNKRQPLMLSSSFIILREANPSHLR
jgi:hypothetical protein